METRTIPVAPDRVTALIEDTLRKARLADTTIFEVILPALPPSRRLGAERALRLIEGRQMFRDDILDEIGTLVRLVEKEVAAGLRQMFREHDSDPSHGHVETVRDDRSEGLAGAALFLRDFARAIADAVDAVEAQRIVAQVCRAD